MSRSVAKLLIPSSRTFSLPVLTCHYVGFITLDRLQWTVSPFLLPIVPQYPQSIYGNQQTLQSLIFVSIIRRLI